MDAHFREFMIFAHKLTNTTKFSYNPVAFIKMMKANTMYAKSIRDDRFILSYLYIPQVSSIKQISQAFELQTLGRVDVFITRLSDANTIRVKRTSGVAHTMIEHYCENGIEHELASIGEQCDVRDFIDGDIVPSFLGTSIALPPNANLALQDALTLSNGDVTGTVASLVHIDDFVGQQIKTQDAVADFCAALIDDKDTQRKISQGYQHCLKLFIQKFNRQLLEPVYQRCSFFTNKAFSQFSMAEFFFCGAGKTLHERRVRAQFLLKWRTAIGISDSAQLDIFVSAMIMKDIIRDESPSRLYEPLLGIDRLHQKIDNGQTPESLLHERHHVGVETTQTKDALRFWGLGYLTLDKGRKNLVHSRINPFEDALAWTGYPNAMLSFNDLLSLDTCTASQRKTFTTIKPWLIQKGKSRQFTPADWLSEDMPLRERLTYLEAKYKVSKNLPALSKQITLSLDTLRYRLLWEHQPYFNAEVGINDSGTLRLDTQYLEMVLREDWQPQHPDVKIPARLHFAKVSNTEVERLLVEQMTDLESLMAFQEALAQIFGDTKRLNRKCRRKITIEWKGLLEHDEIFEQHNFSCIEDQDTLKKDAAITGYYHRNKINRILSGNLSFIVMRNRFGKHMTTLELFTGKGKVGLVDTHTPKKQSLTLKTQAVIESFMSEVDNMDLREQNEMVGTYTIDGVQSDNALTHGHMLHALPYHRDEYANLISFMLTELAQDSVDKLVTDALGSFNLLWQHSPLRKLLTNSVR